MDITWECFAYVNASNKPAAFESMCRLLFKHQFVSEAQIIHANPNNAGIECEPIVRISDGKRISFQSKFFENSIGYSQIKDSMDKAATQYAGQIDIIYLYCNKSITIKSSAYTAIVDALKQNSIEIIPVCNEAVLSDLLIAEQHKETIQNIIKQYFYLQSQFSTEPNAQSDTPTINELSKTISALSTQVEELQPFADENKKLVDAIFNDIILLELVQDEKAMWEKLKPYVENVQNQSNKHYVNFFHLAAQLCLEFSQSDADKYFGIAVHLHEKLDQRLFNAAVFMRDGKYDYALDILPESVIPM